MALWLFGLAAAVACASAAVAAPLDIAQLTMTSGCANGSLDSGPPAFSTDGTIAFQSNCDLTGADPDRNPEVFRYGTVNNTLIQITSSRGCNNGDIASGAPASSPDGRYTVVVSACDLTGDNADNNFELYRYDARQRTLTQVTRSAGCSNFAAAVSADGSIAFASSCDLTGGNADGNVELFRIDGDTAALTQLTTSSRCTGGSDPVVSADGRHIIFVSDCDLTGNNADENHEIFAFDTDSNRLTQLTFSSGCVGSYSPAISGDGTRAAFVSGCDLTFENSDGNAEIFGIDLRSGVLRQLTDSTRCLGNFDPSLSADGGRMAFASTCNLTGDNAPGNWEIFELDPASEAVTQITSGGGCLGSFTPSLSADGRRIAFKSYCDLTGGNADHNLEIFLAQPPVRRPAFAGARCSDRTGGRFHACPLKAAVRRSR